MDIVVVGDESKENVQVFEVRDMMALASITMREPSQESTAAESIEDDGNTGEEAHLSFTSHEAKEINEEEV
jgi:hypothetical protein